jgi:predicted component of type VI protein secretion system
MGTTEYLDLNCIYCFQNDMVKEEVRIDARVHSRLIGARGRNIRKIMEQYSVDIKFPRSTDADPDIVTVIGAEENVLDAREHLLNLEEEYVSIFTVQSCPL